MHVENFCQSGGHAGDGHDLPAVMSVSMYPGTMALTLMPPSSSAKARVKPSNRAVSLSS